MIKGQKDQQEKWLSQLIEAIAVAKDIPKARLWKQIRQNEQAHTWARQVRCIFSQEQTRTGLTQVNIPDQEHPEGRVTVNDKAALECTCLDEAHKCFTQAAATPILQLPLQVGLHSMGVGSEAFQQILAGTYDMS